MIIEFGIGQERHDMFHDVGDTLVESPTELTLTRGVLPAPVENHNPFLLEVCRVVARYDFFLGKLGRTPFVQVGDRESWRPPPCRAVLARDLGKVGHCAGGCTDATH